MNEEPVSEHKRAVNKYSSHEKSGEIDREKQNKSHVQKKRTATETHRVSFWFLNLKLARTSKRIIILTSHN